MSKIRLDLPLLEAMALAKRLDGKGGLSAAECDAAQRGHQRLVQALSKADASSYESGIETIAESLVGETVRLERTDGRIYEGELEKVAGFRTAFIKDEPFSHPVNLSLVKSIKAVERVAA